MDENNLIWVEEWIVIASRTEESTKETILVCEFDGECYEITL